MSKLLKETEEEIRNVMKEYRERTAKAEAECIWKAYDLYKRDKPDASRLEIWEYLYDNHQFEYDYSYFGSIIRFREASIELTNLLMKGKLDKTKAYEINNRINTYLQPLFIIKNPDLLEISTKKLHARISDFRERNIYKRETRYLTDRLYMRYSYLKERTIPKLISGLDEIDLSHNSVREKFIETTQMILDLIKIFEQKLEKKLEEAKTSKYEHPTQWQKK